MSHDYSKFEIIGQAEDADLEVYRNHVSAFVTNFVEKEFRSRWRELLTSRPKQLGRKSSRLHDHLAWNICTRLKTFDAFLLRNKQGIYFNFDDPPKILSTQDAYTVGFGRDALFFIELGKEVMYFFHENEIILCEK